jgi:hypothetical protein
MSLAIKKKLVWLLVAIVTFLVLFIMSLAVAYTSLSSKGYTYWQILDEGIIESFISCSISPNQDYCLDYELID